MSSILEAIELTKRSRHASRQARQRRRAQESLSPSCFGLLEEAAALELQLDDIIDTLRQQASQQLSSH